MSFNSYWNEYLSKRFDVIDRTAIRQVYEAGLDTGYARGISENPRYQPFDIDGPLRATFLAGPELLSALRLAVTEISAWRRMAEAGPEIKTNMPTIQAAIAAAEGRTKQL